MSVSIPGFLWTIPLFLGVVVLSTWVRSLRLEKLREFLSAKPKDSFWPSQPSSPAKKDPGILRGLLLVTAAVGLLGALSGFTVGTREIQLRRSAAPLILVMDISRSMSVQDVRWGRLEAAKLLVRRVAARLTGTSLGLTVFAGETYQLLPPGPDRDLFFTYMESLDPGLVTSQGTAFEAALTECARMAEESEMEVQPVFLLLSDGEDVADPESLSHLAEAIRKAGGVLATVSFGTEEGGLVPAVPTRAGLTGSWSGASAQNQTSNPHSSANPGLLRKLAEAGGGRFASAQNPTEVTALLSWLEVSLGETEVAGMGREGVDRWSWLILISLLALAGEASLAGPLERQREKPWT